MKRWMMWIVLGVVLRSGVVYAAWDCYSPQPGHPTAAEKTAYITELAPYAREAEQTWGPPAAALLAMAANEGGYGWTRIALYANNLYGWKYYSSTSAGGRLPYTLSCQPSWDPNNQYVTFSDHRDSVLFVAMKLATLATYKPVTDRYVSDIRNGVNVITAVNRWVAGIQAAGYNPNTSYVTTTENFLNNYQSPSGTYSATNNLYQYSPVTGAVSPTWISIDAPTANGTVSGDVAFNASVGGGSVDTVKFYSVADGGTSWYLINTDTSAPYSCTWATNPWVTDGIYQLKAEAWSAGVLVATEIETVTVKNAAPTITFTTPVAGATVSADVSLTSSVAGGTATAVKYYSRASGTTNAWYLINTATSAPWTINWATTGNVPDGNYDLKAEAWASGAVLTSSVISVAVKNAVPQTYWSEFSAPKDGSQVAGTVVLTAAAGGNPTNNVSSVQFSSRAVGSSGSWYLINTATTSPYTINWATSGFVPDGAYNLKADAYAGATLVASKTIAVNVRNADTTAPTVTVTSPANGSVVANNVTFTASASDASGIAKVEFYSDSGNYLIATATTSPYTISWATNPWVKNGAMTLIAKAYDTQGNVAQSTVTVTVDNAGNGITLSDAVDSTALSFTSTGNAGWYADGTYYYTGTSSARSGIIGNSQTSTMTLTASGPKTLTFQWRVSSEQFHDYLELWIDGVKQNSITGSTSWAAQSWWLVAGSHTIQFTYRKDAAGSAGLDAGFVDTVKVQ